MENLTAVSDWKSKNGLWSHYWYESAKNYSYDIEFYTGIETFRFEIYYEYILNIRMNAFELYDIENRIMQFEWFRIEHE